MYSVKVAQRKALLRSFIWFYIASLAEVFVALLLFSLFALSPRQLRWSHRPSARDKSANETREVFRDDSTNGRTRTTHGRRLRAEKSFSVRVRPSRRPMPKVGRRRHWRRRRRRRDGGQAGDGREKSALIHDAATRQTDRQTGTQCSIRPCHFVAARPPSNTAPNPLPPVSYSTIYFFILYPRSVITKN